jgi:hypothetical protein
MNSCRKINEKLKSIAGGVCVAALNTGFTVAATTQCPGSCQTCGGQCLFPMLGLAASGVAAYAVKQILNSTFAVAQQRLKP